MNKFNRFAVPMMAAALLLGWSANNQPASAYRAFMRGQSGGGTAYARQNAYGGRAGARYNTTTGGGGFRGASYAGPNGGNVQGGSAYGYQTGVGGARQGAWSGTGPNGTTGNVSSKQQYNAQTGQGTSTSQAQFQNASGQQYGYTGNTAYTKGQGTSSTIQTDNNGTYDVNLQKGQAPSVTQVPAAQ